nr:MAG TPA: hypothetical protein [Caudoviricetes sp.]
MASCDYARRYFYTHFDPVALSLNCAAIRPSFLGVKERMYQHGVHKKSTRGIRFK